MTIIQIIIYSGMHNCILLFCRHIFQHIILRWKVGILDYLITETKTSRHTNKQKYRLRLFNFSTLWRREIFIFINEEWGISVRASCTVLSTQLYDFVCQQQKLLGNESCKVGKLSCLFWY